MLAYEEGIGLGRIHYKETIDHIYEEIKRKIIDLEIDELYSALESFSVMKCVHNIVEEIIISNRTDI